MPLAKIHLLEGRYDQNRITKISSAIQSALINTLRVPPEDFFQLIFELPKNRFLHAPAFVGMHYSDDLIVLEISFIQGRSKETPAGAIEGHQHARRCGGRHLAGRCDDRPI